MNIQSAEYVSNQGRPGLVLTIDGHKGYIGEFKYTLLEEGLVPIRDLEPGFSWADALPPITLPEKTEGNRRELQLRGFTNDPKVIQMARDFWDAINGLNGKEFHPGPVPIPK